MGERDPGRLRVGGVATREGELAEPEPRGRTLRRRGGDLRLVQRRRAVQQSLLGRLGREPEARQ